LVCRCFLCSRVTYHLFLKSKCAVRLRPPALCPSAPPLPLLPRPFPASLRPLSVLLPPPLPFLFESRSIAANHHPMYHRSNLPSLLHTHHRAGTPTSSTATLTLMHPYASTPTRSQQRKNRTWKCTSELSAKVSAQTSTNHHRRCVRSSREHGI
jgi:hypothetical protein